MVKRPILACISAQCLSKNLGNILVKVSPDTHSYLANSKSLTILQSYYTDQSQSCRSPVSVGNNTTVLLTSLLNVLF